MNGTHKKSLIAGSGAIGIMVAAVLGVEGGYVNHPNDPGGETNHGITLEVARNNGYTGEMKNLPPELAQQIYYEEYVMDPGFFLLVPVQPAVAHKLVDAGVNIGPINPSRWFQKSLNSLSRGGKDYPQINVDGKVGPATIQAYLSLEKTRGKVKACELILKMLDAQQAHYYMNLHNLPQFTVGWVDHRIGNVPLHACQDYGAVFDGHTY